MELLFLEFRSSTDGCDDNMISIETLRLKFPKIYHHGVSDGGVLINAVGFITLGILFVVHTGVIITLVMLIAGNFWKVDIKPTDFITSTMIGIYLIGILFTLIGLHVFGKESQIKTNVGIPFIYMSFTIGGYIVTTGAIISAIINYIDTLSTMVIR